MITLVTGGSGSGKSAYAEDVLTGFGEGERIYIATMYPFDEESQKRISRHRMMRAKKNFSTVECYTGLKEQKIPPNAYVLLECMSNLVANEMFQETGAKENTVQAVLDGVANLEKQAAELVIVTNEIFSDGIVYEEETIRYQEYLGRINREIAKKAATVVEVVYGIPVVQKQAGGE
ncbi:MAG: bifunctional adenosylcobinamide kinase/adenosylcobinamide-phosphate guanylyltransferase [Firmicutes bacterium]|nr:bifunctional adenosylcobinamide kinase/adenosylcobinamide-phosphate guanylyltransferase [Bacillota bacterium]MDY3716579.1 bifunctional adenosylcobinamide kinase/adenosylcobinamide-phosphate guanylyltransferase [Blautia sp.]